MALPSEIYELTERDLWAHRARSMSSPSEIYELTVRDLW